MKHFRERGQLKIISKRESIVLRFYVYTLQCIYLYVIYLPDVKQDDGSDADDA